MAVRAIILRVLAAAAMLVAGIPLAWLGLLGMWTQTFLVAPADKAAVLITLFAFLLVFALGFFLVSVGLAVICKLLARGARAILQ